MFNFIEVGGFVGRAENFRVILNIPDIRFKFSLEFIWNILELNVFGDFIKFIFKVF